MGWAKQVRDSQSLAIVFHNGNNFDVPYLFERAQVNASAVQSLMIEKVIGATSFCNKLSVLPCMSARYYRKTRQTAEGLREWGLFDLPGAACTFITTHFKVCVSSIRWRRSDRKGTNFQVTR